MSILITKEIKDSVIESYWVQKYESGIYHLCINTVLRWVRYHQYCDEGYFIYNGDDENADNIEYDLVIPELEHMIPSNHLCTTLQCKDQISFYWIPFELITDKIWKLK